MPDSCPVFKIQRYSIHDGPGIRTTLFFNGCPLSCVWCHNPESQGAFQPLDPRSLETSVSALMAVIEKDLMFFDESGGGVTFSGGEPLCQPDLLFALLAQCKEQQIHTCLDTCGFALVDIIETAAQQADLVLYDVKLIDDVLHERHTGCRVTRILDNLVHLSDLQINLKLRFPVIPGITDTDRNINDIIAFLTQHTRYRDIHLLPYHPAGVGKYEKLNRPYTLNHLCSPSQEHLAAIKAQFESSGFNVTIGG